MSKGLEALERVKSHSSVSFDYFYENYGKDLDVIEKGLKEYEMEHTLRVRLENINYELVREKQENENKLKALEIIKNRKVNVLELSVCANYETFISFFKQWNWHGEYDEYVPTEEEYYLLKEVLL